MPRKAPAVARRYTNRSDLAASPHDQQPVQVPTGQPYGDSQALSQSQSALPLPGDPYGDALSQAKDFGAAAPLGLLTQPSARPDQPITAGASVGPGPGPEMLYGRTVDLTADTFDKLAMATGDPTLAQMAQRARRG